ncbi:MAG: hypothetical protein R2909_15625 [Gemmatimonadales bacterium]
MRIRGSTRVFALLGDPVAHSLSPAMHNAAFNALGLDAAYVCLRVAADQVGPLMTGLSAAGGGGNVTAPHKLVAAGHAVGPGGGRLPIVNTFWAAGGQVAGDDTDTPGILAAWRSLGAPAGPWLLIGTGGTATAAANAAALAGAQIAVRSRSIERQLAFEAAHEAAGRVADDQAVIGFVVNCTPLGHGPADPLPIGPDELPECAPALDLVYRPGGTPWVRQCAASGRAVADGREVLLAQGVEAFRRWFPEVDPPAEVMRAALREHLGPPLR